MLKPRRVVASLAVLILGTASFVWATSDRPESASAETPITVSAAGDLGGSVSEISPVANLTKSWNPDRFLLLGDICYPDGTVTCYQNVIKPVYGPVQAKTIAAPGNHDAHTANIAGFFSFYPDPLPKLWEIGNGWVVITINTEVSHGAGSAQELAVKALAAQAKANGQHIIAITHHPRYTACSSHNDDTALAAIVADLESAGADLFLAGHNHCYERFQFQPGSGIRFFTVGTGGNGLYSCNTDARHAYCDGSHHGALKLELYSDHYDWQFVTTAGQSEDAGSSPTRSGGNPTTTTTQPTTTTTAPPTTTTQPPTTTTTTTTPTQGCGTVTRTYSGSQGQTRPGTISGTVDARQAYWLSTIAYPITFSAYSGACWNGGIVWGLWDPNTTPWTTYHGTSGFSLKDGAPNTTVKNAVVLNYGDSFGIRSGDVPNWTFDHVRAWAGHDDAIEDDWNLSGTVNNSLLESYVGFSARSSGQGGDGSANLVTIRDAAIHLMPTATVYKGTAPGTGPFFKLNAYSPRFVLQRSTFVAGQLPNHGDLKPPPPSKLAACSGNVVLWLQDSPFPEATAWKSQCPDTLILTGTDAWNRWQVVLAAWEGQP